MVRRGTIHQMRWTGTILVCTMCASASGSNGLVGTVYAPEQTPLRLQFDFDAPELIEAESLSAALHPEEVTRLRMQGADPMLVQRSTLNLPAFDATNPRLSDWERSPLVSFTPISDGLTLGSDIRFDVGRSTALRDGGIAGSHGTLATDSKGDELASLAQDEGEYDLYNLALSWDAFASDEVRVQFTSGLKAIDAHINKRTNSDSAGMQKEQRVAALPVIGTGVEWSISERLSITGSAQTHPIEGASSIVDFSAMTAYSISDSVNLSVGYSLIRSSFDVGSIATELSQEGLFARLQISF